jgi:hypothetical protein
MDKPPPESLEDKKPPENDYGDEGKPPPIDDWDEEKRG